MKRRLLWQIYPAFLIIIVIGLFAISWNVKDLIRTSHQHEKKLFLERVALLSVPSFEPLLDNNSLVQIQEQCSTMGAAAKIRYTVIDPLGKVLGDSEELPEKMVNHFDRPEFQQALKGKTGISIRPSETLEQEMMYVAIPITRDGNVAAVLRTSVAMDQLQATQQSILKEIVRYGIIIAVVLAAVSLALSWKISHPLDLLRQGAERFAKGDLSHRLPIPKTRDFAELAVSMNEMAAQLDDRIRTVMAQKNEQQAVLTSMIEGVVAISIDGHILSINSAAAEILQASESDAVGRTVEEVFRNNDLQEFVALAADSDDPVEKQVVLHESGGNERFLQVLGTTLRDDQSNKIGVLVVLNDITHIRKLEKVRRDFVANVSHELKTPVTSIKGFIETLLDGAIDKPEDRRRFIEIIARQTNRLDSIIDDLLALSRIEQQSEHDPVMLNSVPLKPILIEAAGLCELTATEKNITVEINCSETLTASVNSSLLEQAIVNLVDNAIKYSESGNDVRLEALQKDHETLIHVHDHGCGINAKYLPRVFERFYRVDKARSRKLGGTGLGLAIVKHIAQYHQGTVTVESIVGQGSTFTIHLPNQS